MDQLSIFDLMDAAPPPPSAPRRYSFQVSSAETTRSFHVFGSQKDTVDPSAFDVKEIMNRFPLITYYLRNDLLGRDKIVDVMFHELDEDDQFLRKEPDVWLKIPAADFYAAYAE